MSTNVGMIDRVFRFAVAALMLFLAFGSGFAATGVMHWGAIAIAAIMVLTAVVGTCPLYTILGLRTYQKA